MGTAQTRHASDQVEVRGGKASTSKCDPLLALVRLDPPARAQPIMMRRKQPVGNRGREEAAEDARRHSEACTTVQLPWEKVVVARKARSNNSSLHVEQGTSAEESAETETEAETEPSPSAAFPVEQIVAKMQDLLQPVGPTQSKVRDLCSEVSTSLGHTCPLPLFALALGRATWALGCRLAIRRVMDPQQYWSSCLGSTFVVCALAPVQGEQHWLIVSPGFKDLFATPQMSPRYWQVWSTLPHVYVGCAQHLVQLLRLLSYELTLMFESQGRHLPPWRSFEVMAARWMSSSCTDVAVPVAGPHLEGLTRAEVGLYLAETKMLMQGRAMRGYADRVRKAVSAASAGGAARMAQASASQQGALPLSCPVLTGFDPKPLQQAKQT